MNASSRQSLAVAGLLFVTFVWGLTFIYVKWTIAETGVYYFLFLRFFIAAVLMVILSGNKLRSIRIKTVGAGLLLGLFFSAAYISQTVGLLYTTASNSAMITGLYMVIVPFIAYFVSRRLPDMFPLIGIAIALPGLYLLTQYGFAGMNRGDLFTVVTAFSCALHIVLTGELTKRHPLVPLVMFQFIFTFLVSGAAMFFVGERMVRVSATGWFTVVFCAVFATCVAFIIQTAAQRVLDPSRVGVVFAMEAVFGALFGCLIGGEVMTALSLAGAGLMVAGMVISEVHSLAKGIMEKVVG